MLKGSIVHVRWLDAEVNNEWTDEADLHKPNHHLSCETVGFLVKNASSKNPVYVVASSRSLGEDGKYEYNAITKIPKAWVQEITTKEQV